MSQHHELARRPEKAAGSSSRGFGILFAAVFAGIGLAPIAKGQTPGWAWICVALSLGAVAWMRPVVLAPANRAWTRLAVLLSRPSNAVITALLFYGLIVPVGLIFRIFVKDPLRLGKNPSLDTYWIERKPPGPAPKTMKYQF